MISLLFVLCAYFGETVRCASNCFAPFPVQWRRGPNIYDESVPRSEAEQETAGWVVFVYAIKLMTRKMCDQGNKTS